MPGYKTIQEYLVTVEEQIRWKRKRPALTSELRSHLEDQRDAFIADGYAIEEAERLAVEEMGDPVEVGAELDRIHRPVPQWKLLGMTVILSLVCGYLRVWLTAGSISDLDAFDPCRTALALFLGVAALLGGYFLDCSRLLCRPKTVYIAAVTAAMLTIILSPDIGGKSYYTGYVAQIFPVIYAVWLYAWNGKGWKGLLFSITGVIPLAFLCAMIPSVSNMLLLLLTGFVLLLLAVREGWFRVPGIPAAAFVVGTAAALVSGVLMKYGQSERAQMLIKSFFHPELSPMYGWQAVTIRKALEVSRWLGKGAENFAEYPFEQFVPEWSRSFLLTTIVYKMGWLPFLLLTLFMTTLIVWMLWKCFQRRAGQLLVMAVVLIFLYRTLFSVVQNTGYVMFYFDFPLLTGNLQSVVDMGLIGLALSVFREGPVFQENRKRLKYS